jgi:hypothetical protein
MIHGDILEFTSNCIIVTSSWEEYKSLLNGVSASLGYIWIEKNNVYSIISEPIQGFSYKYNIRKNEEASDALDFQNNFMNVPYKCEGSNKIVRSEVTNFPPIQIISGTVSIDDSSLSFLSMSSTVNQGNPGMIPWLITGSVTVNNLNNISGTNNFDGIVTQGTSGSVPWKMLISDGINNFGTSPSTPLWISGTVTQNNFVSLQPASGVQEVKIIETLTTQSIIGTVSVSNQPITQSVKIDQTIQLPVSVSNFPATQTITGSIFITNPVNSVNINNFPVTQQVTGSLFITNFPPVQVITGSVVVGNQVVVVEPSGGYGGQIEGRSPDGANRIGNPVLIAGEDGIIVRTLLVDSLGRLVTAPPGSSTSVTSSLVPGYVATNATTQVAVRGTVYTEQTVNGQRSIVSSNVNDSSAGTGARSIRITYFDQNMLGPFTETISLNGTVAVNTVNTNICYIEDVEVITVGSGEKNAGIISLKTVVAGGGATIASIAIGDNRTFFAHHYINNSQTTYITGLSVGHNGTTVGSGGIFVIKAKLLNMASSVEVQISDFIRLYGQSSTITRNWGTAIKIPGPARITVYVAPEGSTAITFRAALDLYDQ